MPSFYGAVHCAGPRRVEAFATGSVRRVRRFCLSRECRRSAARCVSNESRGGDERGLRPRRATANAPIDGPRCFRAPRAARKDCEASVATHALAIATSGSLVARFSSGKCGAKASRQGRRVLGGWHATCCVVLAMSVVRNSFEGRRPRLLERVRMALVVRHDSPKTVEVYVGWARRFILFHERRHPSEMGAAEVASFLSSLATEGSVSASTQNQALAALLFLYSRVLEREIGSLADVVHAKRPAVAGGDDSRRGGGGSRFDERHCAVDGRPSRLAALKSRCAPNAVPSSRCPHALARFRRTALSCP